MFEMNEYIAVIFVGGIGIYLFGQVMYGAALTINLWRGRRRPKRRMWQ
jgi:hypothetical protein